jgi:hypothetical protein
MLRELAEVVEALTAEQPVALVLAVVVRDDQKALASRVHDFAHHSCYESAAKSSFASRKSTVSKPSVNQA